MAKGGWDKKPSEFMVQVKGDLTTQRRMLTMEVLQGVVLSSPVDSGAFRASHQVTIDAVTTNYDMEKSDKAGSATINEGLEAIASIKTPFGESVVQTNLPYSHTIEFGGFSGPTDKVTGDGFSVQAPQGVYGLTFIAVSEKNR